MNNVFEINSWSTTLSLDALIACPLCHGELPLAELREHGHGRCGSCNRPYRFSNGVFNLVPAEIPDQDIAEKWKLWEQLQDNGVVSYNTEPKLNLSVDGHEQAKRFGEFCAVSGVTLDVGCGPQAFPSYAGRINGEFVGIDPLLGVQPRKFPFVQGIAEYLPFPAGSFDHVLFGTSLDHMISPRRALAEARRVLRPDGRISIWFGDVGQNERGVAWFFDRVRAAASMAGKGDWGGVVRRLKARLGSPAALAATPSYLSTLAVPDGAADHFHVLHLDWSQIRTLLDATGLEVAEYVKLPGTNSRFVRARIPAGA